MTRDSNAQNNLHKTSKVIKVSRVESDSITQSNTYSDFGCLLMERNPLGHTIPESA